MNDPNVPALNEGVRRQTDFQVVLRADGLLRLGEPPYPRFEFTSGHLVLIHPFATDEGMDAPVSRGVYIHIHGPESSLDAATTRFSAMGVGIASVLSLAANTFAGDARLLTVFDCTPGTVRRGFSQRLLERPTGVPAQGRLLPIQAFARLLDAAMGHPEGSKRLGRAIAQYHQALAAWTPGYEMLSFAHLFMAVDALTPSVRDERLRSTGATREELAEEYGVDILRRNWKNDLDGRLRTEFFFNGDHKFSRMVREVSDGFEHGFMDFANIRLTLTNDVRTRLAKSVREGIVNLMALDNDVRKSLTDIPYSEPLGNGSIVPILNGFLIGEESNDALHRFVHFPQFEFNARLVTAGRAPDGVLRYKINMNYTPHDLPDGMQIEITGHELRGPEGAAAVSVSELRASDDQTEAGTGRG